MIFLGNLGKIDYPGVALADKTRVIHLNIYNVCAFYKIV
jgi:hypothetical protein